MWYLVWYVALWSPTLTFPIKLSYHKVNLCQDDYNFDSGFLTDRCPLYCRNIDNLYNRIKQKETKRFITVYWVLTENMVFFFIFSWFYNFILVLIKIPLKNSVSYIN